MDKLHNDFAEFGLADETRDLEKFYESVQKLLENKRPRLKISDTLIDTTVNNVLEKLRHHIEPLIEAEVQNIRFPISKLFTGEQTLAEMQQTLLEAETTLENEVRFTLDDLLEDLKIND